MFGITIPKCCISFSWPVYKRTFTAVLKVFLYMYLDLARQRHLPA